ncbi:MAG: Ig-like domain-containing protein [Chloroflexota bacterium]
MFDDSTPEIISTIPTAGQQDVPPDTNITIQFNKTVTLFDPWYEVICLPGNTTLDSSNTRGFSSVYNHVTLDPDNDLEPGDTCTMTVFAEQVADRDDRTLESDFIFSFTVGDDHDRADVNRDDLISPVDAIFIINRIGEMKDANNAAADVDNDGDIDVDDLNAVVSRIGESVSE